MLNVVLYEPEIPPNTGNIGRLCHATNTCLHLIEPLGFSLDEKSLRRAGLDYWPELEVKIWPSWEEFAAALPDSAECWFLTTKTQQEYWDAEISPDAYLVFGPETRGLPQSLLQEHPDHCLTIPQQRGRSLNLATSAGIVLLEAIRQNRV